jgi:alpha-beta hydrolase superfamily lysophospholipase
MNIGTTSTPSSRGCGNGKEICRCSSWATHQRAADLSVPVLILHGSADRMVPPEGSRSFFAKVRYPDREFREYPGAYHALFADINHGEVLGDLERWLEAHIPVKVRVT